MLVLKGRGGSVPALIESTRTHPTHIHRMNCFQPPKTFQNGNARTHLHDLPKLVPLLRVRVLQSHHHLVLLEPHARDHARQRVALGLLRLSRRLGRGWGILYVSVWCGETNYVTYSPIRPKTYTIPQQNARMPTRLDVLLQGLPVRASGDGGAEHQQGLVHRLNCFWFF